MRWWRFGFMMTGDHSSILQTIQPMLSDSTIEIRKKVAICLGAIVGSVNDELFRGLMEQVIQVIKNGVGDAKLLSPTP